ncbi:hypothetical protein GCM10010363_65520 [Streptomyces omiyaensis]|nr:hypothetical protein GCM10010363_65520 [Streptomyces omiyaensis]
MGRDERLDPQDGGGPGGDVQFPPELDHERVAVAVVGQEHGRLRMFGHGVPGPSSGPVPVPPRGRTLPQDVPRGRRGGGVSIFRGDWRE